MAIVSQKMSQQPSDSLIQRVSLVDDLDALRRGLSPLVLVERLARRFKAVEQNLEAFLAEEERFERLQTRCPGVTLSPLPSTRCAAAAFRRAAWG